MTKRAHSAINKMQVSPSRKGAHYVPNFPNSLQRASPLQCSPFHPPGSPVSRSLVTSPRRSPTMTNTLLRTILRKDTRHQRGPQRHAVPTKYHIIDQKSIKMKGSSGFTYTNNGGGAKYPGLGPLLPPHIIISRKYTGRSAALRKPTYVSIHVH